MPWCHSTMVRYVYLDSYLHRLFQTLKRLNIYDNSMIIITSDHGESFGNHGIMTHGFSLYEEEIRVPLIIKYPSSKPYTGIIEDPVSLVDVLPTILSTLGFLFLKMFKVKHSLLRNVP